MINSCQKTTTAPEVSGVSSLTIFNGVPGSTPVIPVIGTSSAINWFASAQLDYLGGYTEYSPLAGLDTVYVVQDNGDTSNINPKNGNLLFYNALNLKKLGIYSLFLCGYDTSSPDFVFNKDTLPEYRVTDSVMGIRFVNLLAGAPPISVNLEGAPNGSEVGSLLYKGLSRFKPYVNNSTTVDYQFIIRDAASGDSLTILDFNEWSSNAGYGFWDPVAGYLPDSKNVTIVIWGSETNVSYPISISWIDNF